MTDRIPAVNALVAQLAGAPWLTGCDTDAGDHDLDLGRVWTTSGSSPSHVLA